MFKKKIFFICMVLFIVIVTMIAGIGVVVYNNFFDYEEYTLNEEQERELEKLLEGMNLNKELNTEMLNDLIINSYDSILKEEMEEDLKDTINEYAELQHRITSFAIADVDADNENELITTYIYPYDGTTKEWEYSVDENGEYENLYSYLNVYKFEEGLLNLTEHRIIDEIGEVFITDLIPDEKKRFLL